MLAGCGTEKKRIEVEKKVEFKPTSVVFEKPISSYYTFKKWLRSNRNFEKNARFRKRASTSSNLISSTSFKRSTSSNSIFNHPYWKMAQMYEKSGRIKRAYDEYKRLYYYCKRKRVSFQEISMVLEKLVDLAYKLEYWQEGAEWERELYRQR